MSGVKIPASNQTDENSRALRVWVAGNAVLDITPVFPASSADRNDFRDELVPGRLIPMNGVDIHAGGACCNTGAALRFYGFDVEISAGIGCDAFGDILSGLIQKCGLSGNLTRMEGANTSYTVVLAPPNTDRIFLHDPGAGDYFDSSHVPEIPAESPALFHFGYPPLMRKMYEKTGEETVRLFRRFSSHGIPTSLDMAMVSGDSPAASVDWTAIFKRLLPFVDYFLPSLEEICFFIDPNRYHQWKKRCGENGNIPEDLSISEDIAPLAEQLLTLGAGVVVVKCGAYGIYYRTADKKRLTETAKRIGRSADELCDQAGFVRAFRADHLVSANGAGDAAVAGFLAGILRGHSLEESVRLGAASGACSVGGYDAVGSLLPIRALMEKIRDGWPPGREIRA